MLELNLVCPSHGIDYKDNCQECNKKQELFNQEVEIKQQEIFCSHETIDIGDNDTMYIACIKCGAGNWNYIN